MLWWKDFRLVEEASGVFYLDFSDCWWKGWLLMCEAVSSLVMASSPASFQRPAGVTKMAF